MRRIDADALKRDICQYCNDVYSDEPCEPSDCEHMRIIDNQPTINAVELVHGRCKWCNGDYHTTIMATAIRHHTNGNMDGYELKVNYCPNCGAKMDGERKDE